MILSYFILWNGSDQNVVSTLIKNHFRDNKRLTTKKNSSTEVITFIYATWPTRLAISSVISQMLWPLATTNCGGWWLLIFITCHNMFFYLFACTKRVIKHGAISFGCLCYGENAYYFIYIYVYLLVINGTGHTCLWLSLMQ